MNQVGDIINISEYYESGWLRCVICCVEDNYFKIFDILDEEEFIVLLDNYGLITSSFRKR